MLDLIWIGNTLYPRWFVMLISFLIVAVPLALAVIALMFAVSASGHRND